MITIPKTPSSAIMMVMVMMMTHPLQLQLLLLLLLLLMESTCQQANQRSVIPLCSPTTPQKGRVITHTTPGTQHGTIWNHTHTHRYTELTHTKIPAPPYAAAAAVFLIHYLSLTCSSLYRTLDMCKVATWKPSYTPLPPPPLSVYTILPHPKH